MTVNTRKRAKLEEESPWIAHEDVLNHFIPGVDVNDCASYRSLYETVLALKRVEHDMEEKAVRVLKQKLDNEFQHALRMQEIAKENLNLIGKIKEYQDYYLQHQDVLRETMTFIAPGHSGSTE